MDNPQITAIEWFFGYGGNHLGLKRVIPGLHLVAACEIEAYADANMVAKMEAGLLDSAPIWTDCKTFPCEPFVDRIDLFVASYPCQGFSAAGQRKGEEDPRYLWPWVRRAVGIIRPRYVFFENVEGHISLGLREVLTDLACLGYRVENSRGEPTWGIFSAEECGATHWRKRVFILAELADGDRERQQQLRRMLGEGRGWVGNGGEQLADAQHEPGCAEREPESRKRKNTSPQQVPVPRGTGQELVHAKGNLRRGEQQARSEQCGRTGFTGTGEVVAYSGSIGHGRLPVASEGQRNESADRITECGAELGDSIGQGLEKRLTENDGGGALWNEGPAPVENGRPGLPAYPPGPDDIEGWRRVLEIDPSLEPALCGVADGNPNRVDRLRLCGNGVDPDTAEKAFRVLYGRFQD